MMTLRQFSQKPKTIPLNASWYLLDLAEARGRQELYTRQAPQRLKALREHALIESAVSSNRIEGVQVEKDRIRSVVLGRAHLRDRNEEEVRGYRKALQLIHGKGAKLAVSEATILELHRLARGGLGDAGEYKKKDSDIIERSPDGSVRMRFKTVPAKKTAAASRESVGLWELFLEESWIPAPIAIAAFNLDFLCIHPFRDGNGRVSRLLLLLQCYGQGYEVGRYISLERLIEENKDRYYETLEHSSHGWHEGKHDPWPYINYLLYILKSAYQEFEERAGQIRGARGMKTQLIEAAVAATSGDFTVSDIERASPGVSRDMIRRVLRNMKKEGKVKNYGRGPGARWRKNREKG